jgi:hypothetical protein
MIILRSIINVINLHYEEKGREQHAKFFLGLGVGGAARNEAVCFARP